MGRNLQGWREEYEYHSGQASKVGRTLALGGIGIIWVFKNSGTEAILDPVFSWPLLTLSLSLVFDLLHYVIGAVLWYFFFIEKEESAEPNDNIEAPFWIRKTVTWMFYIKIAMLIVSYGLLIWILSRKLF